MAPLPLYSQSNTPHFVFGTPSQSSKGLHTPAPRASHVGLCFFEHPAHNWRYLMAKLAPRYVKVIDVPVYAGSDMRKARKWMRTYLMTARRDRTATAYGVLIKTCNSMRSSRKNCYDSIPF